LTSPAAFVNATEKPFWQAATAVVTGRDLDAITIGLVPALRATVDARAIAVDRVRYVGEPVAIVVARDRYLAEDGCDLIEVHAYGQTWAFETNRVASKRTFRGAE
jgi:CO/xanthine dehydrogenase Mo-binding subunit